MLEEKTYKNYKELKEAMQWKTNSNQITEAQLEELTRVCDYVKDGRAYRIIKLKNKNMEDILLEREFKIHFGEYMKNNTFRYTISSMGQWYMVTIKVNNHIIELRDSLKLLPFSVKQIGKSFKTKHQKSDMECIGYRYAGCKRRKLMRRVI